MFIGFANFYQCFTQSFSKIALLLTSLLKITRLLNSASKTFKIDDNEVVGIDDGSKVNKTIVNLSKNNKSKNLIYILNIKAIRKPIFLIFNAKKIFNYLRQTFFKALIF